METRYKKRLWKLWSLICNFVNRQISYIFGVYGLHNAHCLSTGVISNYSITYSNFHIIAIVWLPIKWSLFWLEHQVVDGSLMLWCLSRQLIFAVISPTCSARVNLTICVLIANLCILCPKCISLTHQAPTYARQNVQLSLENKRLHFMHCLVWCNYWVRPHMPQLT